MSDNRIKPDILSSNTLLRQNLEASAPPEFQSLAPDTERDTIGENRHLEIRRDNDTFEGTTITLQDIDEAVKISNRIAPEHLELSVEDPESIIDDIKHAGAIFMGTYSSEALGDYCAGTNHVLPTSSTARFSSPLGVYDFIKRSSIVMASKDGANKLGKTASVLAYGEGLEAHAKSALYRTDKG